MKGYNFMKIKFRIVAIITILSVLLSTSGFATSTRASDQISGYSIDAVSPSSGRIAIKVVVIGTGIMDEIGAESIYIYEANGTAWRYVDRFSKDDPGMYHTDTHTFADTIYYDGEPKTDYKLVVTIFAEDEHGSDSRTKDAYVTTK